MKFLLAVSLLFVLTIVIVGLNTVAIKYVFSNKEQTENEYSEYTA